MNVFRVHEQQDAPVKPTVSYAEVSRSANTLKEKNDCAVRAVALISGKEYRHVHTLFEGRGRVRRYPTKEAIIKSVVSKDLALSFERVNIRKPNGGKYTATTIGRIYPEGRYLVWIRRHVFALVDGKVLDWTAGRRHRVIEVWRFN